MTRVLIVEDDVMLNSGICYNLELNGYYAEPKYNMKSAIEVLESNTYDLIILDVNLSDGSGYDICRHVRKNSSVPIIFLTACDLEEDAIRGFKIGADDYITKPFSINIFMQKVEAILRRCGANKVNSIYEEGRIKIDFSKLVVIKPEKIINITPTEGRLLRIFVKNKGQVLTRKILLEKLWDDDGNFVDEHTLTVNINRLRNKIDTSETKYIKTIYGMGYMWNGENN